jgi:hypothetical protein
VKFREKAPRTGKNRHAADMVLESCERLDWVGCSNATHAEGLELGLFLQLHDDDGKPLGGAVWARLAYRNYTPIPVTISRAVASRRGKVARHNAQDEFVIRPGRDKVLHYKRDVLDDAVRIDPGPKGTGEVTATITFEEPAGFIPKGHDELAVSWPPRGRDSECACCSRFYPT